LGPIAKGENKGLENIRVEYFDPMMVGFSRAFVRIKNEMNKLP
jgi:hypothetical protein